MPQKPYGGAETSRFIEPENYLGRPERCWERRDSNRQNEPVRAPRTHIDREPNRQRGQNDTATDTSALNSKTRKYVLLASESLPASQHLSPSQPPAFLFFLCEWRWRDGCADGLQVDEQLVWSETSKIRNEREY